MRLTTARDNGAVLHEDRRRASTFGDDPEQYDRARPTYPAALIDELMRTDPVRVLDVGCGTGIAGRLFAARGCEVVGVEADARMAAVARRHGLDVEVARFEEWDARGRLFDLVVSGQAWHWVDPDVGGMRAADALRPQGRLGVFWNFGTHEPETKAAFEEAYARTASELSNSYALGTPPAEEDELRAFRRNGRFDPVEVLEFRWERRYTRSEWLDQLPTHSDHRLLPESQRRALLDAVGEVIDGLGGSLLVLYRTKLISGFRIAH
jgi:SAM-dependent methyltransferase